MFLSHPIVFISILPPMTEVPIPLSFGYLVSVSEHAIKLVVIKESVSVPIELLHSPYSCFIVQRIQVTLYVSNALFPLPLLFLPSLVNRPFP